MTPCAGCGRELDRLIEDTRYDVLNPAFDLEGNDPPPGPYCLDCFAKTPTGGQVPAEPVPPVIEPDPEADAVVFDPEPDGEVADPATDVDPDPAPAESAGEPA